MADIPTPSSDRKPDVYAEPQGAGYATIVANKKGRAALNRGFEKPRPRWAKLGRSKYLKSPEYLCLSIENGAVPQVMLGAAHQAGCHVWFMCTLCDDLHVMDDALANRFITEATFVAEGVHPAPGGVQ